MVKDEDRVRVGTTSTLSVVAADGVDESINIDRVLVGRSTQTGGLLDHCCPSQYRVDLPISRKLGRQMKLSTVSRNCALGYVIVMPRMLAIGAHPAATDIQ